VTNGTFLPAHSTMAPSDPARIAAEEWLAQYTNLGTLDIYTRDLRWFFGWCQDQSLHPLTDIRRVDLAHYRTWLERECGLSATTIYARLGTLRSYYDSALIDDHIAKDPTHGLKMPRPEPDETRKIWLDRYQVGALLRAAEQSKPSEFALIHLLASLGLRITSTCDIQIEDVGKREKGYRWLITTGKNGKRVKRPLPAPVCESVEKAIGERKTGPLLIRRDGSPMTRRSADRVVKRLALAADLPEHLSPHDLRRSFITNAIDADIPLAEVQYAVDHKDPRTTATYDRRGRSPHRHASMMMAALYATAA
jgi:integrase/recombinase XerD